MEEVALQTAPFTLDRVALPLIAVWPVSSSDSVVLRGISFHGAGTGHAHTACGLVSTIWKFCQTP